VWSVDRLGRSSSLQQDVVNATQELRGAGRRRPVPPATGVRPRTPGGQATFGRLAVSGEFGHGIVAKRANAGRARGSGRKA
jgi:hypothetical protein